MVIENRIGFMQGRLSNMVNNQIQSFPWETWQDEFKLAESINLKLMEWTLDYKDLKKNPLIDKSKHLTIKNNCVKNEIKINSLTGDCFMQCPFWKSEGKEQAYLKEIFKLVFYSCVSNKIQIIVLPLVDNGSIESSFQERELINFLISQYEYLKKYKIQIAFESDFSPKRLASFIKNFPSSNFGINYDVGNSASMGFEPQKEFEEYGSRIINVHIKDRKKNGSTVPLGHGDANFDEVFKLLFFNNYKGNFILQTARCTKNDHIGVLDKYKKFVYKLIKDNTY